MRILIFLIIVSQSNFLLAQDTISHSDKNIGINYFGELGLRPGIEIDCGFPLWNRESMKEKKKRKVQQYLHFRPSIAYYFYARNSNNFLLAPKLNYQLRFAKASNGRYFFIESSVKIGYLRKSLIGEKYRLTDGNFEEVKRAGTNSIVLGSGLDFGGYVSKSIDWLIGFDYLIESTQDQLILHRFVAKLGVRKKL